MTTEQVELTGNLLVSQQYPRENLTTPGVYSPQSQVLRYQSFAYYFIMSDCDSSASIANKVIFCHSEDNACE